MDIRVGDIVKSIAGHDKGSFYYIVRTDDERVYIADGRRRKIEKLKAKSKKHVQRMDTEPFVLEVLTNNTVKRLLWRYNFGGKA